MAEDEAQLCDPDQVCDFVEEPVLTCFAPAIGTAHGVYKTKNPKIDFDRLETDRRTDQRRRDQHAAGGPWGHRACSTRRRHAAVSLGGSKFNVSTDLKHTLIDATYDYISAHREEYNPGKVDATVKAAIKERIHYWIDLLGSAGKA